MGWLLAAFARGAPALIVAAGVTFGFSGLVGGRRMNCLGVLLLPMTLNMIGVGPVVSRWLGLI